jgi:predicted dehydrogenase
MKAFIKDRGEPLVAHYRVNAGFLPPEHWLHDPAQGGGRIIGEGCHFLDFLTFLVGEAPQSVIVKALPDSGRYRGDNVVITLSYPDGSLGTVTYLANGDKSVAKEYLEVFAGGRVVVLDDFRKLILVEKGRKQQQLARLRQDKGHQGAWEAFVGAVAAGGPPPIPYDQLLGVTQATFAAMESLRTGEEVDIQPV